MTKTLTKTPIVVPEAIRRKAGLRRGEQLEFKVSGRSITIVPKLTPDEFEDQLELQDPKVQEHIRKSHEDFLAGRSRPAEELLGELSQTAKRKRARSSKK